MPSKDRVNFETESVRLFQALTTKKQNRPNDISTLKMTNEPSFSNVRFFAKSPSHSGRKHIQKKSAKAELDAALKSAQKYHDRMAMVLGNAKPTNNSTQKTNPNRLFKSPTVTPTAKPTPARHNVLPFKK